MLYFIFKIRVLLLLILSSQSALGTDEMGNAAVIAIF